MFKSAYEAKIVSIKHSLEPKWISFHDAVGKTIAKTSNKYEALYVVYTDGTFTAIGASSDSGSGYVEDVKKAYHFDTDALFDAGLIPADIYEPWKAEVKQFTKDSAEKYEREQYERLNAKFGGGTYVVMPPDPK